VRWIDVLGQRYEAIPGDSASDSNDPYDLARFISAQEVEPYGVTLKT